MIGLWILAGVLLLLAVLAVRALDHYPRAKHRRGPSTLEPDEVARLVREGRAIREKIARALDND